jgi:hypothetical protein
MTNGIRIYNLENNEAWEKRLTDEEYNQVKDYVDGKDSISMIPAMFKPVRTNNLKNFSKDFFLPTTINHAIRVQNTVGKIFAILASLVLDVFTFPLRLLTCLPRVISNANQKENLLHKYLITQGVEKKLLESDHVRIRLEWKRSNIVRTPIWTTKNGVKLKHNQAKHWMEKNVNFIEVPTYEGSVHFSMGMNC